MARLVWTPPASVDVARLRAFPAPKNPDAARRAAGAIRQGVKTLAAHPEIGRAARGLPAEFREWFIPFGQSG
jgi:plasmid stabilization system protein ParE